MNPLQSADVRYSEAQGFGLFMNMTYIVGGVIAIGLLSYLKISNKTQISWTILSIFFIIECLIIFLMASIKMETVVTRDTLYIRFIPLILSFKPIPLENIVSIKTDNYSALGDYGGWGVRGNKKDRCYNARGNRGVRITYNNGNKLLIGSQKPEELELILKSIVKLPQIN